MWAWLQGLFARGRVDLYRPRQRLIFHYWNGQREVHADPLVLYRRMMDVGPELDVDLSLAQSTLAGYKTQVDGHLEALAKIRTIFEVQPLAEGGLTETESFDLLYTFMAYTYSLKKNGSTPATSSTSSAPTPSSVPGDGGYTTTPTSASA